MRRRAAPRYAAAIMGMTRRLALFLFLLGACLGSLPAQTADAPAPVSPAAVPAKERTLLDLYRTGGFVMHPLLAMSVALAALAAYLQLSLRRAKLLPVDEGATYAALLSQGKAGEAWRYAQGRTSLLSRALADALGRADARRDRFNRPAMESAAADLLYHEEGRLLTWVHYLNVISTLAPMLGLLGTVTGMIASFEQLQTGRTTPTDLAGGIGEAMIATASGLLLAIPAMFAFFHYRNVLSTVVSDTGQRVGRLLDLLTGEATLDGPKAPEFPDAR